MIIAGLCKIVWVAFLFFQNENRLIITHLVIPQQRGTAGTCEAINEKEIFDFITGNNLQHLGWIRVSLCVLGYGIYSFIKYDVMARVGLEFWVVICFIRVCRYLTIPFCHEDRNSSFLQHVGEFLPDYMVSHTIRQLPLNLRSNVTEFLWHKAQKSNTTIT